MEERTPLWLLLLGGSGARLFQAQVALGPRRGLLLEQVDELRNPLTELERGVTARELDARPGLAKKHAELLGRYAADLVQWTDRNVKRRAIDELEVFGPSRLFSLLRSMAAPPLAQRMTGHQADLGDLTLVELQRHPEILKLLDDSRRRAS